MSTAMVRISRLWSDQPLVTVLRLEGVIGGGGRLGGASLSDRELAPLVERAFTRGKPKAVALAINSPGGSPTQSALITARIRRLAEEEKVPVYAFCEDVAASGGYWLATAADEIYVDANSILGSIGVISAGFGLNQLIERWGIERRVYTAGEDKSMLDPFRPERPRDIERLKDLQATIHKNFIHQVKSRRGARLGDGDLFTGDIFVGDAAVATGLADGIGHLVPVMKQKFGPKTRFSVSRPRRGLWSRLGGVELAEGMMSALETRAHWARYGL